MSELTGTAAPAGAGGPIFVKWGGSLITDKARPGTVRPEVIRRLADELAALAESRPRTLVLGHGSGSFGHPAASRHGVAEGVDDPTRLAGVSRTQDQAARLHRLVIAALIQAGAAPFSVAPGSALVAAAGRPVAPGWEPVWQALALGLLPVVHGDVVLDRERGSAILSTEGVFVDLARELARRGGGPPRVFWLGETAGVWDAEGQVVERIGREDLGALGGAVGGSAATDVTGGMRHRLDSALELAALGATSWILDGRERRVVERVLAGEALGTRVEPEA